jgi:hypothetical protein
VKPSAPHLVAKPSPPATSGSKPKPVHRHRRHVTVPKHHRRHAHHHHLVQTPAPPTTVVAPPPVTRTPAPPSKPRIGVAVGGHKPGTIVLRHPSFPS